MSNVTDTWISARPTTAHPLLAPAPRSVARRSETPPWRQILLAYLIVFTCFFKLAEAILSGPTVERHGVRCEGTACSEVGR